MIETNGFGLRRVPGAPLNGIIDKGDSWSVLYRNKKGRIITCTARRYLALHQRLFKSDSEAEPCLHGHFDCAVVDGGPCSHEVAATVPGCEDYLY